MFLTAQYTDTGGRSCNEDSVSQRTVGNGLCLVLADGLGGHGGGDRASAEVCRVLGQGFCGDANPDELAALLGIAHEHIRQMQTPQCAMKSTAVVLALSEGKAAWTHVGDSRLYHFWNGQLVYQTRDHSASQLAVTLGDITADQIRFHEDRSRILRALGQEGDLKIDAQGEFLSSGNHAFLLCSDGFWEYVLEEEMQADLQLAASPEDWLDRMLQRLAQRRIPDHDNNTAAVVWLTQE